MISRTPRKSDRTVGLADSAPLKLHAANSKVGSLARLPMRGRTYKCGKETVAQLELLHNIPAPYRVHLFNCLSRSLEARGDSLHVHFFGANNPDRPASWQRSLEDARFSYKVWDGYPIRVRGTTLWLNPSLVWNLARRRPDVLLHGGVWDSVTSLLAVMLARPRRRIAWMEFNVDIPGRSSGVVGRAKRALLLRSNHLLVPGRKGLRYLEQYMGDELLSRAVVLPNVVDESRFSTQISKEDRARARAAVGAETLSGSDRLLLWPARLIGHKGILEFLQHVDRTALDGLAIRIIGEGPLRREVLHAIEDRGLAGQVSLVDGYVDYRQMPAIYRASDALLLPSLHDPNPLSVVEALHSGLPMLLSNRVGNFEEALAEGQNGFGFDPLDGNQVRTALRRFRDASAEELRAMGERSAEIGATAWSSQACVDRAVEAMLGPVTATGAAEHDASRSKGVAVETYRPEPRPLSRRAGSPRMDSQEPVEREANTLKNS